MIKVNDLVMEQRKFPDGTPLFIRLIGLEDIAVFFPDTGVRKRYASLAPGRDAAYGVKERDWESGRILGLSVD